VEYTENHVSGAVNETDTAQCDSIWIAGSAEQVYFLEKVKVSAGEAAFWEFPESKPGSEAPSSRFRELGRGGRLSGGR